MSKPKVKMPYNLSPRIQWLYDYYYAGAKRKWNNEFNAFTTGTKWDVIFDESSFYIVPEVYSFFNTFNLSFNQAAVVIDTPKDFYNQSLVERKAWFIKEAMVNRLPKEILPGDLIAGGRFNLQASMCLSKKEAGKRARELMGKKGLRNRVLEFHDRGFGNCGATCGNGVVEPPETCDDNCPTVCNDNDACTTDALSGQANECNVRCTSTPITACSMTSDGCCPANCNSLNDADCQPVCPNGVVEAGEKCDGNCPTSCDDGNACTANTLIGSAAQCTAECTYSTISQCSMTSDGCCPSGCTSINDVDCDSSGLIGDPCTSGGECVSGACLDEANTGWSGGYCTAACGDPALNPTECGSGAHCAAYDAESGYGFCFRDCANNNSCRTPYYQCFDWDGDGTRSECAPVASVMRQTARLIRSSSVMPENICVRKICSRFIGSEPIAETARGL